MRIAFVTQPWDGIGYGSSLGIITCNLASSLLTEHDLYIYAKSGKCLNVDSSKLYYRYISLKQDNIFLKILRGLEKVSFIGKSKSPLFSSNLYYFFYAVRVALSISKDKIDIVHIHNYSQFVNLIRLFNKEVKIILHMHCEWLSQLDKKMIDARLGKVNAVIGCSDYISTLIKDRFPYHMSKVFTLENGVDLNNFYKPEDFDDSSSKIKLLFVGRVSPEKGLHVLIDAFEKLSENYQNLQLDIIGPIKSAPLNFIIGLSENEKIIELKKFYNGINYEEMLLSKISEKNKHKVKFLGAMDSKNLSEYYKKAEILINPSYSEAFGMSLIEAMACGIPVIGSRIGGMIEVVEKSNGGLLFEVGNSEELADCIKILINNENTRIKYGNSGRDFVKDNYSWDKLAERLNNCYYDA